MADPLETGPRIYVRLMEHADARVLSQSDLIENETWYMERGRMPTSAIAFEHMLRETDTQSRRETFHLAICLRETDEMIGSTTIRNIDWVNRNAETGIRLFGSRYRHSGYGPEAKHLSLKYAFEVLGMHAMRSDVYEPNFRSVAALRKQGYREAGRIQAEICRNGIYRDILVFDLLRPEWEEAYATWQSALEQDASPSGVDQFGQNPGNTIS